MGVEQVGELIIMVLLVLWFGFFFKKHLQRKHLFQGLEPDRCGLSG